MPPFLKKSKIPFLIIAFLLIAFELATSIFRGLNYSVGFFTMVYVGVVVIVTLIITGIFFYYGTQILLRLHTMEKKIKKKHLVTNTTGLLMASGIANILLTIDLILAGTPLFE